MAAKSIKIFCKVSWWVSPLIKIVRAWCVCVNVTVSMGKSVFTFKRERTDFEGTKEFVGKVVRLGIKTKAGETGGWKRLASVQH